MTDPRLPTVDEVRHNRDLAGASTSEQLRQTQAALAASQQDLTKAANKTADVIEELWAVQKERDLARAELATATRELEQLRAARSWMVARDGGRTCVRCDREIRRGEAYEPMPGIDELQHVHCPDAAKERQ